MPSKYLDGSMVPRSVKRNWDQRCEPRLEAGSQTAIVELRGCEFSVPVANLSRSGAMVILSLIPHIGETISIRLAGRASLPGRVCWVRGGKIGISFAAPVE
jgi:hypothetical protein